MADLDGYIFPLLCSSSTQRKSINYFENCSSTPESIPLMITIETDINDQRQM